MGTGILILDKLNPADRTVGQVIEAIKTYSFKLAVESDVLSEWQFDLVADMIERAIQNTERQRKNNPWTVQGRVGPDRSVEPYEREELPLLDYQQPQWLEPNLDDEYDWSDSIDIVEGNLQ